jgi:glutaredoxin
VRFLRKRPVRHIMLYGKPGCHLCEEARRLLDNLQRSYSLTIEEIDITTDPALFRAYDIRIPVLVVDGATELEAPIRQSDLQKALKAD